MKNVVLIIISICLLNSSLSAKNKTLDDILEKHKGKEAIPDIEALVDEGINAKNRNGTTALIYASQNGHTDIVQALIEAGANINIKNKVGGTALGDTALIYASQNGHTYIVELLEAAGAKE